MNVLIVTSWYPNSKDFINGVFVKEQATALHDVGINSIVFYPYDNCIKQKCMVKNVEDGIITYRANTDYLKNSKVSRINSIIITIKFLRKIAKECSIDLIHCHVCYPAGFAVSINSIFMKIPYLITEHMSTVRDYCKMFYNKVLFKFAYRKASMVITVSKFLGSELKSLGFEFNWDVIGNVVNVGSSDDVRSNYIENKHRIKMLYIGNMNSSQVKGLQYLIPAFADYHNKNPKKDVKLTLVGDGEKRKDYEDMCKNLNIEGICTFLGNMDKKKIFDIIREHDFLVLSSIKETFGCVLIEAMACGKPVLATKCGGPQEFVNSKTGIVVESKSIESLEVGIEKMVKSYNDFNSKYIKDYAVENFSGKCIAEKLKRIYLHILEG